MTDVSGFSKSLKTTSELIAMEIGLHICRTQCQPQQERVWTQRPKPLAVQCNAFFKQKVTKVAKGENQGASPKNANKSKRDEAKCEKEHKEKTGAHSL